MQSYRDVTVLQQQFVTPAASIDRGSTVMGHDHSRGVRGCLQPEAQGEWIDSSKVADARECHAVVAIES